MIYKLFFDLLFNFTIPMFIFCDFLYCLVFGNSKIYKFLLFCHYKLFRK